MPVPSRRRPGRRPGNPNKVYSSAPTPDAAKDKPTPKPVRRRPPRRNPAKPKEVGPDAEKVKVAKKLDELAAPQPKKLEDNNESHLDELRKVLKQEVKKQEEGAAVKPKRGRGRPRKNPQ